MPSLAQLTDVSRTVGYFLSIAPGDPVVEIFMASVLACLDGGEPLRIAFVGDQSEQLVDLLSGWERATMEGTGRYFLDGTLSQIVAHVPARSIRDVAVRVDDALTYHWIGQRAPLPAEAYTKLPYREARAALLGYLDECASTFEAMTVFGSVAVDAAISRVDAASALVGWATSGAVSTESLADMTRAACRISNACYHVRNGMLEHSVQSGLRFILSQLQPGEMLAMRFLIDHPEGATLNEIVERYPVTSYAVGKAIWRWTRDAITDKIHTKLRIDYRLGPKARKLADQAGVTFNIGGRA